MGNYLNPGNDEFKRIIKSSYIDKTGLISIINSKIDTKKNLICVTRPRRFGKSYAAQMLCAYYDCTCDSKELFEKYDIAATSDFTTYLNKYNVIYLDITSFISTINSAGLSIDSVVKYIQDSVIKELYTVEESIDLTESFTNIILQFVNLTGKRIVFIIDEWDAIIREAKDNDALQNAYLNLLRSLFKNGNFTSKAIAAAYMTGILPIKKDGTESSVSDFDEYTIISPGKFAEYTGFTEKDISKICSINNNISADDLKAWYDGYSLDERNTIYNPYSVMQAVERGKLESYWRKTTAAETLFTYINLDFKGLQEDIARLIAGEQIEVDVNTFNNDVKSFNSKDDVLTLLIHLGYLAYDNDERIVRIPNKGVRIEFEALLKSENKSRLTDLVVQSQKLFNKTLDMDGEAVAEAIDRIRCSEYAPTFYNNEQALRYVIKFAYISCVDTYNRVEELPSGKGVADVVYIPNNSSILPGLIVELKWNKSDKAAISQIKEKSYPNVLKDYCGDILLVGINYDEKTKKHSCTIEKYSK